MRGKRKYLSCYSWLIINNSDIAYELQLHEELLVRHHSAFQTVELSTAADEANSDTKEIISDLGSLHEAVLTRIRERHAALCDRADAWEIYKSSLAKLLSWLDNAEKEKNRLELRQIQEHGTFIVVSFKPNLGLGLK